MSGKNPGRNISYIKQDEPNFLKQFKQRIGYKEGPNVDTKREQLPEDDSDEDRPDQDDERPTVVVLKKGDLTAEEAEEELAKQGGTNEGSDLEDEDTRVMPLGPQPKDGPGELPERIVFKKPSKRRSADNAEGDLNISSNKKRKEEESKKSSLDKKRGNIKSVSNKQLLSFGDDEEEEDDDE